jgi:hypothetical protein
MKQKIYLGKSNRANPDVVSRVRSILKKYDLEILEYKGGRYTDDDLLESDFMIVIPDMDNIVIGDYFINTTIGKGLYGQIDEFLVASRNTINISVVIKYNDKPGEVIIGKFSSMGSPNFGNYIKYSSIESTGTLELHEYLDNIIKVERSKNVKETHQVGDTVKPLHTTIKL